MKKTLTTLLLTIALIVSTNTVSADGTEKKVECTTGAYGQHTCKTIEERKNDRVLGEKKMETPVDAGLTENVMLAIAGLAAVSMAGLVYSKN